MEIQIAVAKVTPWASRESGDTLETIERPTGGLSLVLVDGQHSTSLPLAPHMGIVAYTDRWLSACVRRGQPWDARAEVDRLHQAGLAAAQTWADDLLALERDQQRASDDISVLVVAVLPRRETDTTWRLLLQLPPLPVSRA